MNIVSKFTRGVFSKVAKMALKKKTGYEVDIQLNELTVTVIDGKAHVHLNADAELEKDELVKILKMNGLD